MIANVNDARRARGRQARSTIGPVLAGVMGLCLGTYTTGLAQSVPAAAPQVNFLGTDSGHSGYTRAEAPIPLVLTWKYTAAPTHAPAAVVYRDGTVYAALNNHVMALKAADGTPLWWFPMTGSTPAVTATPALDDTGLYVGGSNGSFYKLDLATGKPIWTQPMDGPVHLSAVIDQHLVFVADDAGNLSALDSQTGKPRWSVDTGGPLTDSPLVSDAGQIVITAYGDRLSDYDETDGRPVWNLRLETDSAQSPPVCSQGTIYTGAGDTLYAYTAGRGAQRWHLKMPNNITTPVAASPDMVYVVTEDNVVYGVSSHGHSVWSHPISSSAVAAPLISGDTVIVATQTGSVYAMDAESGRQRWVYVVQPVVRRGTAPATTAIDSAPIYVDGGLYVTTDDGSVSAFTKSTPDNIAPQITIVAPAPGAVVGGRNLALKAQIVDEGSGVNPATVQLTIDGKSIPMASYDPSANGIVVNPTADQPSPVPALADGGHVAALSATDWLGNKVTRSWGFRVNNGLSGQARAAQTLPPGLAQYVETSDRLPGLASGMPLLADTTQQFSDTSGFGGFGIAGGASGASSGSSVGGNGGSGSGEGAGNGGGGSGGGSGGGGGGGGGGTGSGGGAVPPPPPPPI